MATGFLDKSTTKKHTIYYNISIIIYALEIYIFFKSCLVFQFPRPIKMITDKTEILLKVVYVLNTHGHKRGYITQSKTRSNYTQEWNATVVKLSVWLYSCLQDCSNRLIYFFSLWVRKIIFFYAEDQVEEIFYRLPKPDPRKTGCFIFLVPWMDGFRDNLKYIHFVVIYCTLRKEEVNKHQILISGCFPHCNILLAFDKLILNIQEV